MNKVDFFARECDEQKLYQEFVNLSIEEAQEIKNNLIKHCFANFSKDGVLDYISYAVAGAAGVGGGVAVASVVGATGIPVVTAALSAIGIGATIACPPLGLVAGAVAGAGALVGATHLIRKKAKNKGEQEKLEEQRLLGEHQVVFNVLNPLIFARIGEFQEVINNKDNIDANKVVEIVFRAYPLTSDEKLSVDVGRLDQYIGTGWKDKILSDSKKKEAIVELLAQSDKKLKQLKGL